MAETKKRKKGWAKKGTTNKTTPSGGVSAHYRREAEEKGHTMPGGSFPINNKEDLANAKHDIGRAKDPAAAKAWVNKRAKELGEPPVGGKKEGDGKRRSPLYTHPRSHAHG